MDAVKFFNEAKRMCDRFGDCEECPLKSENSIACKLSFPTIRIDNPETMVAIVEKWASEHPIKKGYIVVDMPKNCGDCEFQDIYDAPHCVGCTITRMTHEGWDRPDWCPIKEVPDNLEANVLDVELESMKEE